MDRKYGVEVMHLNIKDPRLSSPILDAGFSDFMPPSSGNFLLMFNTHIFLYQDILSKQAALEVLNQET